MKSMLSIAVAGVFLAASSCAYAFDITSDPDATMNQQQKLGPNVYSQRVWNKTYNIKTGPYAYYPRYVSALSVLPAVAVIEGASPCSPLPACGERLGAKRRVRGLSSRSELVEAPPHPTFFAALESRPLPASGER